MRLILLNKPFQVLPQFTAAPGRRCLADFALPQGVYPAGRLDFDSEGLMILTDFGPWQARISQPGSGFPKTYLVQVEGQPTDTSLQALRDGLDLNDGRTLPALAGRATAPDWLWPRDPPIRVRRQIPDAWLELTLQEGRNRQVRRMTAAVGLPTLRLVRIAIGPWRVEGLAPGEWRDVPRADAERLLNRERDRPTGPAGASRRVRRPRSASRVPGPARR